MNKSKDQGFSLVELMAIVAIFGLIIALSGAFSFKSSVRRKIDSITTGVSNTLQSTKLKAAREGVEYRTVFEENPRSLELYIHRGDSNTDSTVWTTVQTHTVKLDPSVVITNMPSFFEFNPNGRGTANSVTVIPADTTQFKRCGDVVVHSLGRIRVIKGNWDGTDCIQVQDK